MRWKLTSKRMDEIQSVVNGAGAAGNRMRRALYLSGVQRKNITLVDTKGIIYKGRTAGNEPLQGAVRRDHFPADSCRCGHGADVLLGLSTKGHSQPR